MRTYQNNRKKDVGQNKFQREVPSMSLMSFDFVEDMARMRREIDRILGEDRVSSWTFPFSKNFISSRKSITRLSADQHQRGQRQYLCRCTCSGLDPEALNVICFRRPAGHFGGEEVPAEKRQIGIYPPQRAIHGAICTKPVPFRWRAKRKGPRQLHQRSAEDSLAQNGRSKAQTNSGKTGLKQAMPSIVEGYKND